MKLADRSPEILDKIQLVRWDRIIEKHEKLEDWQIANPGVLSLNEKAKLGRQLPPHLASMP
ncbi:MAG: hypothetical protein F6K32_21265 [Desertifilum sp. SIO1I2]|nr:hypothetical protein [Desertifilum sp. SIO1I2]